MEKAESVLLELKESMKGNAKKDQLHNLTTQFFSCLPHCSPVNVLDSKKAIVEKYDLCQVCSGPSLF